MTSSCVWLPFHSKVATDLVLLQGLKLLLFNYINKGKSSFYQESSMIFVIKIKRSEGSTTRFYYS